MTNGASEVSASVKIDSDIATSFTFASHQNAIPSLRSLAIENPTDHWELGEEVEAGQLDQDAAESEEATEDAVRDGREQSPQDDVLAAAPIADVIISPVAGAVRVASRTEGEVGASPSHGGAQYRLADLSQFRANPNQFFEFGYRATLRGMVDAVMEAEGPLRADVLAQRIARAHGRLRTGARIRERIDLHLRDLPRTEQSSGTFLWRPGTIAPIYPYRAPVDVAARRAIPDIPLADLASIAVCEPALLDEIDPALALARLLGVERLAATSRARLDEALQRAATQLAAAPSDGK